MNKESKEWWVLQIILPEQPNPGLPFQSRMEREALIREAFRRMETDRLSLPWEKPMMMSDYKTLKGDAISMILYREHGRKTVEVQSDNRARRLDRPGSYTDLIVFPKSQRVAVQRHPELARSAGTCGQVIACLLDQAMNILEQKAFYDLQVLPLTVRGTFLQWWKRARHEGLSSITIRYAGPNLPLPTDRKELNEMMDALKKSRAVLNGKKVDQTVTEPKIQEGLAEALDEVVSAGILGLTARASGDVQPRTWSSARDKKDLKIEAVGATLEDVVESLQERIEEARDIDLGEHPE